MPAWPNIRAPLRSGWRGASPDGVRVTPMDSGPPKRRVESIAIAASETLMFRLTPAEATTLDAFYRANKTARVSFTHPVWGACEVAFAAAPVWAEDGPWRVATVQLDVFRS